MMSPRPSHVSVMWATVAPLPPGSRTYTTWRDVAHHGGGLYGGLVCAFGSTAAQYVSVWNTPSPKSTCVGGHAGTFGSTTPSARPYGQYPQSKLAVVGAPASC